MLSRILSILISTQAVLAPVIFDKTYVQIDDNRKKEGRRNSPEKEKKKGVMTNPFFIYYYNQRKIALREILKPQRVHEVHKLV